MAEGTELGKQKSFLSKKTVTQLGEENHSNGSEVNQCLPLDQLQMCFWKKKDPIRLFLSSVSHDIYEINLAIPQHCPKKSCSKNNTLKILC